MKAKIFLLAAIIMGMFLVGSRMHVQINVEAKTEVETGCTYHCPSYHFEWQEKVWDDCPQWYAVRSGHEDQCRKIVSPWTIIDRPSHMVNHAVDVVYEKSEDPHKCHRPSDDTLRDTYGMHSDQRGDFKKDHAEWVDSIEDPGSCPTPTPTVTPTPTDIPEQCTQESWSCSECQELQDNICYETQEKYCSGEYGCGWSEECIVNDDLKVLNGACRKVWKCEDTCEEEPTPTPTPEQRTGGGGDAPTFAGSSTEPPRCQSSNTTKEPANPHVYRKGDMAIAKWFPTDGNKVHIYYKENGVSDWQYSVILDNTGYAEINGLGSRDITFGIMQVNDCSGGTVSSMAIIVDGDVTEWVLFRP